MDCGYNKKEYEFILEAKSIIKKLRERKYPESFLEQATAKILQINGEQLIEPRIREDDNRNRYILTYYPSNPDVKSVILQLIHLLDRIRRNPITVEKVQFMYRKSSNIKDLIVSGLANQLTTPAFKCIPCKDVRNKKCKTCEKINYTNTETTPENITIKIRGNHNCQSEDCIYCLTCLGCKKKYIGESSQTVNKRMRGHKSHIRNPTNPVAQHFGINLNSETAYNKDILDQESDKNRNLQLEEAWIFILRSMTSNGSNTKW